MKNKEESDIFRFFESSPRLGRGVYIDPQAHVSGSVILGDDVSVWPMTVIRGDVNDIVVGDRSNIQDGTILHVSHKGPWSPEGAPLIMGADVTVGHGARLHGCTIEDCCLIGMGAIVLDGAVLSAGSLIAAGAVVAPGTSVPPGTMWRGNPARMARELTERESELLQYSASHYVKLKNRYLERLDRD
jgi:carbonic anhydrase/acetyltransferase-like protein (isoleucine patch superfamily)